MNETRLSEHVCFLKIPQKKVFRTVLMFFSDKLKMNYNPDTDSITINGTNVKRFVQRKSTFQTVTFYF